MVVVVLNYMLFAVYKCQQVLLFFSFLSVWFQEAWVCPEGGVVGMGHPAAVVALGKEMVDRTPAAYSYRIILDSISLVRFGENSIWHIAF